MKALSLKNFAKVTPPAIKPKERLNIKSLMHQKLMKFSKAGLLGKATKFQGPKLKVPKL